MSEEVLTPGMYTLSSNQEEKEEQEEEESPLKEVEMREDSDLRSG